MDESLEKFREQLVQFVGDREWGGYHTPRNLAMALAGEVGELLAELQWVSDTDIDKELQKAAFRARVSSEVADVLIYLLRFCDACGIDPLEAGRAKLEVNKSRFPAA